MFIAMNRFRVIPDQAKAFEDVWLGRDTHLAGVPGFIAFHLLRGPAHEDHTLYSSHTVWRSRADFEALTAFMTEHRIRPIIDRTFSFAEADAAFAHMRSAGHFGKIVIAIS